MITTVVIAFREYLEAFLIIGVFLGISRRLKLKKEKEIIIASAIGIIIAFLISLGTYMLGNSARGVLTERNADSLESYLLIFSGIFIAYVVFSLHDTINRTRGSLLLKAHSKLQQEAFDISLFFTIMFLVLREGFEVALFTASVTLFSEFSQNMIGLLLGFAAASIVGASTFFAYTKFQLGKIFKITEYMIILLGASLVQNGFTKLFETHFNIQFSTMGSLGMSYLPTSDSLIGHLIQSLTGVDQQFSLMRLLVMILYIDAVYFFLIKKKRII
jgi:high-affinity iron transporter